MKFEAVIFLQAIRFLRDSWDLVKSNIIHNCFNHALTNIHPLIEASPFDKLPEFELFNSEISRDLFPVGYSFDDFIQADNGLLTGAPFDDDNTEMNVDNEMLSNSSTGNQPHNIKDNLKKTVTNKQTLEACDLLIQHCNKTELGSLDTNQVFNAYLKSLIAESFMNKKQSDIRSYFVVKNLLCL